MKLIRKDERTFVHYNKKERFSIWKRIVYWFKRK